MRGIRLCKLKRFWPDNERYLARTIIEFISELDEQDYSKDMVVKMDLFSLRVLWPLIVLSATMPNDELTSGRGDRVVEGGREQGLQRRHAGRHR